MKRKNMHAKLVAANLISIGGLLALPAQATLLLNTLTATATTSVEGSTPSSSGPTTDSNYVSIYRYGSGSYSSTGASAWGNAYGTYRAGADGSGTFNSTGRFQREVQLTNDNGYDTDYSLNFFIYYGSMNASSNGATGSGFGSYDLSIKQDNSTTLFASGAKLESDGNITLSGTQLDGAGLYGDAANGFNYYWSGTYVTLNLGTVAAGASTIINFDLVSTAFGDFDLLDNGVDSYGNPIPCYGNYGGELSSFSSYGGSCTGSVYASLGDPNDFAENFDGPRSFSVSERQSQVPLPGTLPLMALGLAALAYSQRFQRR